MGFIFFQDIDETQKKLPNSIGKFLVPFDNFNHMDFIWGEENKKLLFEKIIKIMNKYR